MITRFDQHRSGNGKWVIIIHTDDDRPRIWYQDDSSCPDSKVDPETRLVRAVEAGMGIPWYKRTR